MRFELVFRDIFITEINWISLPPSTSHIKSNQFNEEHSLWSYDFRIYCTIQSTLHYHQLHQTIVYIELASALGIITRYIEMKYENKKICSVIAVKRRDRFNEWNITEHVNFVNNFSTKLTAHAQPSYNEKPQEREGTIVVGNTCVQCKNSQVNCVLKVRHITLCLLSNEWQLVGTHERIAWIVYWNFDSKKLSEYYFVCMPWARAYVFVYIHSWI